MRHTTQQATAPSSAPVSSGVRTSLIDLDIVASVLAAAEVGVWQFSAAGARLVASAAALAILEIEEGDGFDLSEDALDRVHPGDRECVAGELARSRSEAGPFAVEMRILTLSGATRWMEVHGISVHDADGFTRACGTVQDVTARKEQELFRELLLVTLGHDLRNPLTAIQIGAGLLLRRGHLGASDSSTAQRVLASAGRISAMVEQLLDFTRIRVSGTLRCARRPGNLGILAAKAVDEIETEYSKRVIELTTEGDLDGIWDVDRLGQMVRHLASNAITHSEGSSPVAIRIKGHGEAVELTVHNFGRPIKAEEIEGIFRPLRRSSQVTLSGLGLGLFVVHEIVRAHGGTMHVSSSAEAGTLFSVDLPRDGGSTR